ncbi:TRPM8 channel-associated factor 3-like [Penaeus japonicus]|uniref:TRPM8 channel-associated factor 3-like n=1 Tax=Penaeus japonicus TaxID=27405 RepID=UPI001C713BEF|nr:TRPM8 channel-associated factor 3-like [Penaeus japonicus]
MSTEIPVYLLHQGEEKCLAVVSGSTPTDAVIGLASPSNNKEQQWFDSEGQWRWSADPSYCLAPVAGTPQVGLAESSSSSTLWTKDDEDRMVIGSKALTLPRGKDKSRLIMRPIHNGINQKWWTDIELKSTLMDVKTASYPLVSDDVTTYKHEIARGFVNRMASLTEPLPFPRDVARFPGSVNPETPRIDKTLTLDLSALGQAGTLRMTTPRDWQATDLYAAAGDVFQIVLPDTLSPQRAAQITVRVGAHCDKLRPGVGTVKKKGFRRMPIVSETFGISPGINSLRSQYGGNLIFCYQKGELFTVEATVSNVVKAPFFKRGETSVDEWEVSKHLDAPHAILEGDRVVIVSRNKKNARIPFPEELLSRYEEVIDHLNFLAGFSDDDPPPRGKYWLVNDLQISHGSAHAGFPAMFTQAIRNLAVIDTPYHWGVWHELGHNYQQAQYWSRTFGSESTVNLFSLYIQEKLFKRDRLKNSNNYLNTAKAVDQGLTFNDGNCWQKLVFLMEIKHAFPEQGWEMFRRLNRTTRALPEEEAQHLSSDRELQIDYVYKNLSRTVDQDLILTFQRWGLSVSQEAQEEIQSLGLVKAPADLSVRE